MQDNTFEIFQRGSTEILVVDELKNKIKENKQKSLSWFGSMNDFEKFLNKI